MTYRDLAAKLRREITGGALTPGQRLPSLVDLAQQEGVTVKVARRALGLLVEEGYVLARPSSWHEVADAPPPAASWQAWRDRIEERVTELERKAQE